ncbi:beta-mannosidase [Nitrospirillum pindoramense]|uniref:Beta-mannosidase B n=1 Tax=Nitrospirillum amazonense TaxID=28077 RepID=A0A560H429_9PROT|nr:glycoside hydrolase family 2 protein [Nitrospirillum amazonense]TWB41056.1 beta-mannosidase [Nitrospirillum amazonense]
MSRALHRPQSLALVLALALAAPGLASAAVVTRDLDQGWTFRLAPQDPAAKAHGGETQWRAATVPGAVQTDLLALGRIGDPFYRDAEAGLQWIGLADWDYRTTLSVDEATLHHDHVDLVFEGLDTFADISLNGKPLLSADNMFRRWRVPVKQALQPGANTLSVALHSPIAKLQPWLLKQPYALPGEFDSAFGDEPVGKQTSNYVRKANYQYGWDWGPRYVTLGIWRPVRLEAWNGPRLADFHIAQQRVDSSAATVRAEFEITADHAGSVRITVTPTAPDGTALPAVTQDVTLDAGTNQVSLPLRIDHPHLWYPVGYGAPDLYTFKATISDGAEVVATTARRTGLRQVELRRTPDQWGKSFEFVVNGIPVFAKGANLIPMDSFPSRVPAETARALLQSARDANMNMLRMWGGGHYQDDAFYDLADEMGIMVWQDFMFGGAITPYDVAFRESSRAEAVDQVKRLRDHPSIVLWCGNNEVQTGWESWPDRQTFKDSIAPAERERIVTGMTVLFGDVLRGVVTKYAGGVPYWASTPSTDFDGPADVMDDGDKHYWKVWSGSAPLEDYLDTTPRFQSEYGLQSFPVMQTVRAFANAEDLASPNSPVMRAHQKFANGNGNDRLLFYIRKYYGEPKDFAAFVYLSQVMQAEGIQMAAEHLRASRPHSMGSLYWQLNDVWPGASWSSIDYFGRWKALQFHARRFYAPLLAAAQRHNGKTDIHLVSDLTTPMAAQWRLRVMDLDGTVRQERTTPVTLAPLSSTDVGTFEDAALLKGADPARTVAVVELLQGGQPVSREIVYFADAIDLALTDPGLTADLQPAADGYALTIKAQRLARGVWVEFGDRDASLSDNAFDLLPGQTVTLAVRSTADIAALRQALSVRSLAGATKGPRS